MSNNSKIEYKSICLHFSQVGYTLYQQNRLHWIHDNTTSQGTRQPARGTRSIINEAEMTDLHRTRHTNEAEIENSPFHIPYFYSLQF